MYKELYTVAILVGKGADYKSTSIAIAHNSREEAEYAALEYVRLNYPAEEGYGEPTITLNQIGLDFLDRNLGLMRKPKQAIIFDNDGNMVHIAGMEGMEVAHVILDTDEVIEYTTNTGETGLICGLCLSDNRELMLSIVEAKTWRGEDCPVCCPPDDNEEEEEPRTKTITLSGEMLADASLGEYRIRVGIYPPNATPAYVDATVYVVEDRIGFRVVEPTDNLQWFHMTREQLRDKESPLFRPYPPKEGYLFTTYANIDRDADFSFDLIKISSYVKIDSCPGREDTHE